MKNFLKLFALFACFATMFAACNSDETVDDYTPEVKSFETYDMVAGSEKIHVTWTVPNDESITGTKISWSGSTKGSHSISDLTANDQMEYTITELKDGGSYTVTIESLVGGYVGTGSVFVSGLAVYGPETYAKEALPTMGAILHDGTDATVEWTTGGGNNNAGVDVTYTDSEGKTASAMALFDANGAATANLIKAQEGTYFTCVALFQPAGGYDYAEVVIEGDYYIASTELTAATPEISNTLGGKEKVQFSWSVTSEVTKSVVQLYAVSADGDTASGSAIEFSGSALSDIVAENVATYTATSVAAGASYKVEVTNYIDVNSVSTATQAIMSESSMFSYNDDTYAEPSITSVINDRGIVSISWDMSGDKVIASDLLRIEFYYLDDEDATQTAIYNTYDTPLVLTAAQSNTLFTAKAYYMPGNSIEGTEYEVEKVVAVNTEGSNQGEIPAPILYAPQNMTLSPGFDGTESYVLITWDVLTDLDFEEAKQINIYIKRGNRDDITSEVPIVVDKSLGEYRYSPLEVTTDNNYYYAILSTINGDDYETVGTIGYFEPYDLSSYANRTLTATSIERSGVDNADATITWNWTKTVDVAVEVTEYTKVDGTTSTVEKTKYEDATTTTLTNVKGGTDVQYSAYYCPQDGLDSLAIAQTAIQIPYLAVADAPAITLLTGVGESAPFIQVSWESFDYTAVASATLYCTNAEGGDAIVVAVPDVTAGVAVIENLTVGVEYVVYMTLTDNDGVEHTPESPVVVSAPTLYSADTYKEAASVTITAENGATYDGEELTINLDLSDISEELVGIVASYTMADDTAATAGNADYVGAGESIPSTLVMSGIKASSEYVITPYYRPSTGVTAVAGGSSVTLTVPAIAPTVAVVTGVVSSYNKSGDGSEAEVTVSWTLEDNVARVAIKDSKMYIMMVADDATTAVEAAGVSVESGVESYSATVNTTTNGVVADKIYTIYIETRDADSVPYVSNSVSGIKTYNGSTYTTANLPAILAEYDQYASLASVEWDVESLNADITTMSAIYNGQTVAVDMTSGSQTFTYSSSAKTASISATFLPTAIEQAEGDVAATYGETVDVTSDAVTLDDMYYDIIYSSNVYQIYTGEGLVAFAGIVNGTYADSTPSVKSNITDWAQNVAATGTVVANIDLEGCTWTPMASYRGTFNGGSTSGYSISNLTISATTTYQGLFASTIGAAISNITLKSVNLVSTANYAGAIAGTTTEKTTVTNCIVESGIVSGAGYTGGLIGYNAASTVENCSNGAAVTGTGNTGGIVGLNRDEDVANATVNNCYNSGSVTSTGSINGGIVGSNYASGETYAVIVSNCTNDGNVTGSSGQTGGIVGCHRGNATTQTGGATVSNAAVDGVLFSAVIMDCVNNGDITDTASGNVGGIVGYFLNNNIATRSTNNGKIIGASNTAGIVGQNRTNGFYGYVTYCDNYGAVESGSTVAGIVGYNYGVLSVISYCNNYGSVTVPSTYTSTVNANAGGIAGNNTNAASSAINYCNNEGDITSGVGANTGGIVGLAGGSNLSIVGSSSSYNYNSGTVSGITNVGGLVGSHAAVISYYTNKGEVFVSGVSSSSSNGLVGTGTGTITSCTNYFEASAAEAVSGVAAYPTYATVSGVDASTIEVSWSFGELAAIANATKVNVYYKASEADSYSVESVAASLTATSASISVAADDTYSIYVTTVTSDGIETSSDVLKSSPLEVTSYNSSSYDSKLPAAASIANDGTTVTINWEAASLDADLVSITLTYGTAEAKTYTKAELASATTLAVESGVESFSYVSTFKPAAYSSNDSVASVTTSATVVELPSQPAEAVSDVAAYPSYVAGAESDTATINVSWAYGDSTDNIISTIVYYKKSTDADYQSVILSGTLLTSYTLGAEVETIDANATYNVYVATRNSENLDTQSGDAIDVVTYDSTTYSGSLPTISSIANDGTTVSVNWSAESISGDLTKVAISYGATTYEFTSFTEAATFAYDAQYATFSYAATFKPAAYADNADVASVDVTSAEAVTLPAPAAQAVTVGEIYPSYTTEGDVENSNITVEWSYGNGSSYISAVNIYYRASGVESFDMVAVSEDVAATTSKTIAALTAGVSYEVYVATANADGVETLSNYTSTEVATAKAYNSSSYDVSLVPSVVATQDGTNVTLTWANTASEDLVSVAVLYNDNTTTILKENLATTTVAYVSGVNSFTYSATFRPTERSAEVVIVAEDAVTIIAEGTDISLNDGVYEIYSAAGLEAFAGIVNGSYSETAPEVVSMGIDSWTQNVSANAVVKANITLTNAWTPMTDYAGTFDGGNGSDYSISNLTIDATTTNQGLFASLTTGAVVKNVTLSNISITSTTTTVGAIAGSATCATITDCEVSGVISATSNVGGIVGVNYYSDIMNCVNNADVSGAGYTGGIAGNYGANADTSGVEKTSAISNCINNGEIKSSKIYPGGIVGYFYPNATLSYGCEISSCTNNGDVTCDVGGAAGFAGYVRTGVAGYATIKDCTNNGNITGSGNNIGGCIAYGTCAKTAVGIVISGFTNNGDVINNSGTSTGGVAGSIENGYSISNSNNFGAITGLGNNVGGIIGSKGTNDAALGTVSFCNNEGNITGPSNVGGIAGTGAAVTTGDGTNYNSGTVSGTLNVGGLVGNNGGALSNYTNKGLVLVSDVESNATNGLIGTGSGAVTDCVDEYGAADAAASAEAVTVSTPTAEGTTITVAWAYGEAKDNISKVVVYYSADGTTYTSKEVEGNTDTSVTLTSEEGIAAGTTYKIYVVTANSEGTETAATDGGTSESPLSVEVPEEEVVVAVDIALVDGVYEIYTAEGLVAFASIVNSGLTADAVSALGTNSTITGAVDVNAAASAKLMADITLKEEWTPMGSTTAAYTGSFDGDSKVILGLEITNTAANRGFFSYVSGATIKNVTIDTPTVAGAGCSGILVGETAIDDTNPSLISNCHIIGGTLVTSASHAGAIVGRCSSATITGCSNSATLSGSQENMAGIAGTLYFGTAYVEHCINYGAITSGNRAGGIVGNVSANDGTHIVNYCTNKGAITGSGAYTGGVVGYCTRNVYYSANEGSVSGSATTGGIVGGAVSPSIVDGSQSVAEEALKTAAPTSGLAYGAGGNYSKGAVTGTTVGALVGTNATPLSNYVNYSSLTGLTAYIGSGSGAVTDCTEAGSTDIEYVSDTYNIYTANGLVAFANIVNSGLTADEVSALQTDDTISGAVEQNLSASAKLMDSFSLSTVCGTEVGEGTTWTPIGSASAYTGTFDGNGMTISDLYINSSDDYQGLFGYVGSGSTVQDVTLANVSVTTSGKYCGSLIAHATASAISGCEVSSGTIAFNGGWSGCLIGSIQDATSVTSCINRVDGVATIQQFGGIVGTIKQSAASEAYLTSCTNYGNLTGLSYVGGLVGYFYSTTAGAISKCVNEGNLTATSSITGGIVGALRVGTLSECTNNGTVTASAGQAGGMAGLITASGVTVITDCQNIGAVDATTTMAGGIIGKQANTGSTFNIIRTTNSGAVKGTTQVGGIAGLVLANSVIGDSEDATAYYNTGSVTGTAEASVGGLVGSNAGAIYNYKNTGLVTPSQLLVGTDSTGTTDDSCVDEYTSAE